MVSFLTTIFLAALPLALAGPITPRASGEATYFFPGLGACGRNNGQGDFITAVSAGRYDSESLCGRRIRVTGAAGSVDVEVVDRCAGCAWDSLDLSPVAFQAAVGSLDIGRAPITWDFI